MATYGQSFFFMVLYSTRKRIPGLVILPYMMPVLMLLSGFMVHVLGLSLYNSWLLGFYFGSVLIVFLLMRPRYELNQAVALGFLIPFINSFFWEAGLHFSDLLANGPSTNLVLQAYHLIPLALFYRGIRRKWRRLFCYFSLNSALTLGLFLVRISFRERIGSYDLALGLANRALSLMILLKGFGSLPANFRPFLRCSYLANTKIVVQESSPAYKRRSLKTLFVSLFLRAYEPDNDDA